MRIRRAWVTKESYRRLAWAFVVAGCVSALGAGPPAGKGDAGEATKRDRALSVPIEVLPGVRDKLVDLALPERIPVAVLSGPVLDARDLDSSSIRLAGAAVTKRDDGTLATYRDIDGDGRPDLVVEVASSQMRMGERGTRVFLTGRTRDGRPVVGDGNLRTVAALRAERRLSFRQDPKLEKLPPVPVAIDILPGDPTNRIELANRGTVEVAVLSSSGFDATALDPAAISLAGSPVTRRKGGGMASFEDVNGDGRADLVAEVPKRFLRLAYGSTEAVLRAIGPDGRAVQGTDRVQIGDKATMTFDSVGPPPGPEPGPEFVQTAGITINDVAPASPYPSTILVTGLTGVVSKVRVTLKNLSHSYPNDIDILLVGPTGQSLVLMSDVGGQSPGVSNVNVTFDDDSAYTLDALNNPATGTYRPANLGGGDSFPAPAPPASAATTLSVFNGASPDGVWSLYVVDDLGGDTGSIAGGWSIDFIMATEVCNATPITILDNVAAAPYPSPINVSGLPSAVSKVTVKLKGLSHTYPDDIDMLLVGPAGQYSLIMSDAGGTGPGVSNETLVLDDNAALTLDPSTNPVNGTYQPIDFSPGDVFPGLAPPGPYASPMYPFDGTDPNGYWYLYVVDDAPSDSGSIGSGWCLDITTMTPVVHANPTFLAIPNGEPATTTGPASLYPSTLQVSGVHGVVARATVTLNNLTHTYPQDLDILLVAPGGAKILLMSDVGGVGPGVSGVTLTFDDAGPPISLSSNPASGVYQPSNDDSAGPDVFPAPAPAGPYRPYVSDLKLGEPNGTYALYVYDDASGDVGYLAGGWSLSFQTYLDPSTREYPFSHCSFNPITIPDGAPSVTQGPAIPYPSDMIISGFPGLLEHYKVRVHLYGVTHSFPSDLDIVLQGPLDRTVLLMSDAGGIGPGMSGVDLAFDDDAASMVPQSTNPVSGVYRPTDYNDGFADVFPDHCPPSCTFLPPVGPFGTSLSVFNGTDPALAFWTLWVMDDASGDTGSISGWCVEFLPSPEALEVPNLRWTGRTSLAWDAGVNATSYDLFRGDPGQLPALLDTTVDSCPRGSTLYQDMTGLTENPAPGSFFWYLVRGRNAEGVGPAGFYRAGSQDLARIANASAGTCP